MLRWIGDNLTFMFWLSVLQLARLAVVLMCVAEAVIVITLWPIGFVFWQMHNQSMYLLIPIGATLLAKDIFTAMHATRLRKVSLIAVFWANIARLRSVPFENPYPRVNPLRCCADRAVS